MDNAAAPPNPVPRLLSPLPMAYYEELIAGLARRGDVEFITYADFDWGRDRDAENAYPDEWKAWRAGIASGRRDPRKIHLLLQHDCDSAPENTIEMAQVEAAHGARSCIMVFDRWRGSRDNESVSPYPIDWEELRRLRDQGFCIGYHCNAYHNADFREDRVFDQFREETRSLGEKLGPVRFFSPHGGMKGPTGLANANFDYHREPGIEARWVHNRFSTRFNGYFSDGGLRGRLLKGDPKVDLEAWLESLTPGGRYRALVHPQYYGAESYRPADGVPLDWYAEVSRRFAPGRG